MSTINHVSANPVNLPPVPQKGTTILPLMSPDDIYPAELAVINETHPGQSLYIDQYTLPSQNDGASVGTPASDAQRQILDAITNQIKFNNVKVYIIADNEAAKKQGEKAHNQDSIDYLRQMGAYILPYPKQYVNIDHTKLVANEDYAVIASANMSPHQSDSPDDNTGFLFAGAAAHNAIVHSFIPQWNFSAAQDAQGWASGYPSPKVNLQLIPDSSVTWLNTAPGAESGSAQDTTEIKQAYANLIQKAAQGPANAYLYTEQFDVSNRDLTAALVQAKQANSSLDIRAIMDPNMYLEGLQNQQKTGREDSRVLAYNELKQAGIPVKFANVNPKPPGPEGGYPEIFHNKWIAYNDQEVVNGSGNLSADSLNGNGSAASSADPAKPHAYLHNREVDVDVIDSASAKAFKQKFLNDWANNCSDDPQVAAKGGSNGPLPNPEPNPAPNPGYNTDLTWSGYLSRLASFKQKVDLLFPVSAYPAGSSSSQGGQSFLSPLPIPQNLLSQNSGPMPWIIPGLDYMNVYRNGQA